MSDAGPPSAQQKLFDLLVGGWVSRALSTSVELGVIDALADGPLPPAALADRLSCDPGRLERLCELLVAYDLLARDDEGYWLTETSELLVDGTPTSLAPLARFAGAPWHMEAWEHLPLAVRRGTSGFAEAHGSALFDALVDAPPAAWNYAEGLALTDEIAERVVAALPLPDEGTAVDVGGGGARFLCAVLKAKPRLSGVVLDQPAVGELARARIEEEELAERCRFEGDASFSTIPKEAAVYFLRGVIDALDDDDAQALIANVAGAMREKSTIIVLERLVDGNDAHARLFDVDRMVLTDGRGRTRVDIEKLLVDAGLSVAIVERVPGGLTAVWAEKR